MTRIQKTVFILVAIIALVFGFWVNKVLSSRSWARVVGQMSGQKV